MPQFGLAAGTEVRAYLECMDEMAGERRVPDMCTLPTDERPLRRAEFDDLFRAAATDLQWVGPTRARFRLSGDDDLAERVADLARRESSCCSFFVFGIELAGDGIVLDIAVPAAHVDVLKALVARARRVRHP
jgi:hypothetical protein